MSVAYFSGTLLRKKLTNAKARKAPTASKSGACARISSAQVGVSSSSSSKFQPPAGGVCADSVALTWAWTGVVEPSTSVRLEQRTRDHRTDLGPSTDEGRSTKD